MMNFKIIHNSSVHLSNVYEVTIILYLSIENQSLSNLQLVKYKSEPDKLQIELN
jgi:hypothetical protein